MLKLISTLLFKTPWLRCPTPPHRRPVLPMEGGWRGSGKPQHPSAPWGVLANGVSATEAPRHIPPCPHLAAPDGSELWDWHPVWITLSTLCRLGRKYISPPPADINPKVQGIYTLCQGSYQLLSRCFTFQIDIDWWVKPRNRGAVFQEGYSNQKPAITLWASVSINPPLVSVFHIYLKPRKKERPCIEMLLVSESCEFSWELTNSYGSLTLLMCLCGHAGMWHTRNGSGGKL